jgi:hypothetical protein
MKNLYQRLKPQAITAMDNYARQYPITVDALTGELKRSHVVYQLNLFAAITLNEVLNGRCPVEVDKLNDHFEKYEP